MSMVEKVARAIAREHLEGKQYTGAAPKEAFVAHMVEAYWRNSVPFARAAIAAMREPSEGMVRTAWSTEGDPTAEGVNPERAYTAMIDTALAKEV